LTKRLSSLLTVLAVLCIVSPLTAADITITSMSCTQSSDGLVIQFDADATIDRYQKPERVGKDVIIRFIDAVLASDAIDGTFKKAGITVKHERIREFLVIRVTSDHTGEARTHRDGPRRVFVSIEGGEPLATSASSKRWDLDVIVIDAGHGGKDVGAQGVNGVNEKDITLKLAQRLRDKVKAELPGTKVVMTRDDDRFVELYKRTEIANKANGKLFISIHCNSMPKKPHPANGCETYILRPGRNEDAASVAARENAVVKLESSQDRYKSMTEDQIILATMAQRSFVRFSEELASRIQSHVSSATGLKNRGVNQAGFYVLVGASMPNILFETAFISNTNDADLISSSAGQEKMVTAMLEAIKDYAVFYKKTLNN
jgi:N-acetylmuramoyl-L-alanine amidase